MPGLFPETALATILMEQQKFSWLEGGYWAKSWGGCFFRSFDLKFWLVSANGILFVEKYL
jgi:hypothetical protein